MATATLPFNAFERNPLSNIIQSAAINAFSGGANIVIPAVANRSIVVLKYKRIASAAVTCTWQSSGGLVIDGPCALGANGGEAEGFCPTGHFATLPGEALVLFLSSGTQVGGNLLFTVI